MAEERDFADTLNASPRQDWERQMGLRFVRATRDEVIAELDVAPTHHQAYGIVHGGVHASIGETLASVGAALDAMAEGRSVVGLENHTSFVRAVREGTLRATARPLTRGRRSQLWDTRIETADGKLVATSRVRLLVLDAGAEVAGKTIPSGAE